MPVYVNAGYELAADGKEWKHVQSCRVLRERQVAGYLVQKIQWNMDTGKIRHRITSGAVVLSACRTLTGLSRSPHNR